MAEKVKTKKYPLLICMIISCVIIITSLFILGFFGLKLGVKLGGGSQIQIVIQNDASSKDYFDKASSVLGKYGYKIDSASVEDKYLAGEANGEYTTSCLVINIAETEISDEVKANIKKDLATKLEIDESNISDIQKIYSSVRSKQILYVGIAVGLVVIAFFVFGLIRYNVFAALALLLAYLHNIILYLAILILTRVQLSLVSLSIALVLSLVMGIVLIHIFEKYREETKLQNSDKISITQTMMACEKQSIKPMMFIGGAVLAFAVLMLFIPVLNVRLAALNIMFALIVTAYSSLLIGPSVYANLLEINDANLKAVMSRNDTINKEIKKKIKKSASKSKAKSNDKSVDEKPAKKTKSKKTN